MVNFLNRFINNRFNLKNTDRRPYPRKARGTSGTEIFGGRYDEEYLQKLFDDQGIKIYDEMRRSDGQVKMLLSVIKNPIRSAKWSIEPVDESDEELEIATFVEHLLFNDLGSASGCKKKTFRSFLSEVLTMIEFGHSVFEPVHKLVKDHPRYGTYLGLSDIGFRHQRSIEEWILNPDGSINAIRQMVDGDLSVDVFIPGEHLIVFSMDKEGDNYQGISMLRPCYGSWFRKNTYRKFQAIGIERSALSIPVGKVTEDFLNRDDYEQQMATVQSELDALSSHQKNSLVLAQGFDVTELKLSHDPEKVQSAINSENVEMSKAFLANFMELGLESNGGSYSLGSDLSDIFLSGISYIGDEIAETLNICLIKSLVKAKFGPREFYPKLRHSGINDKAGKELADIVKILSDSGHVKPSDRLSMHLHKLYGLPDIDLDADQNDPGDDDFSPPSSPTGDPQPEPSPGSPDDVQDEVAELSDFNDAYIQLCDAVLADVSTVPPKKARDNAAQGLRMRDKWKRGGTDVGVGTANAIKSGGALTRDRVARMSAFARHRQNYRPEIKEDDGGPTAGTIAWLLWGGTEGVDWAQKTLDKLDAQMSNPDTLEAVKLADVSQSVFIQRKADRLSSELRELQKIRSDKMIDTMVNIFDRQSGEKGRRSGLDQRMPGIRELKSLLRSHIGEIGKEAFDDVMKEVGKTKQELKLSEEDFKDLPKKTRDRLLSEILLTAAFLDADLEKVILFSFNLNYDDMDSPSNMRKELVSKRDRFLDQSNIDTAGLNIASKVVNGVRNDVFVIPEVMEETESFVFVNPSPKSAICQNLAGRVFSKEEYQATPYLPPLHHNCKSIIRRQIAGKKSNKPVDPIGLTPTGSNDEIHKILKSKTL